MWRRKLVLCHSGFLLKMALHPGMGQVVTGWGVSGEVLGVEELMRVEVDVALKGLEAILLLRIVAGDVVVVEGEEVAGGLLKI